MSNSSDPKIHQQREEMFLRHAQELLSNPDLRIDTAMGRRPVAMFMRDVSLGDSGVELKKLMSELNKPDRQLQSQMPLGRWMEVGLSRRRWIFGKTAVARLRVICLSPTRDLILGQPGSPMSAADITKALAQSPPPLGKAPSTLVIMSTSGFTADAREAVDRRTDRTILLVWPNEAGGWTTAGPQQTQAVNVLFDPEAESAKKSRVRAAIELERFELLSGGLAADKLATMTRLPLQWIENEVKSYARENAGLTAKRLNGRMVLFQQGAAAGQVADAPGGIDMPFIDHVKALFSRKGDVDKKIALLSERRASLSQQRDHYYEDLGTMENKEADLRKEFGETTNEITRRRITSQLLQIRKDLARRQQLLSVLNQQVNVVSTHLHTLELQKQGKAANLPDSEEIAADAAKAEEVVAQLEADSELADSVGAGSTGSSLSSEEQALYDELLRDPGKAAENAGKDVAASQAVNAPQSAAPQKSPAAQTPRQRSEPQAG